VRQLHLVGFTSDHRGLIFSARDGVDSGDFVLALDDALLEQIDRVRQLVAASEDVSPGGPGAAGRRRRAKSGLTPREMQARMRAGRSLEEIATEAGVEVEWVERFAAPVLAERAAAVARAGELVMHTPRRGHSDRPLAASVQRNLADRGLPLANDELASAWSARQHAPDEWLISFHYRARGRDINAEWIMDLATETLVPRDRQATALGFVDPEWHVAQSTRAAERAAPTKKPAQRPARTPAAARAQGSPGTGTPPRDAVPGPKASPPRRTTPVATPVPATKASPPGKATPGRTAPSATASSPGTLVTKKTARLAVARESGAQIARG
jgi:Protein of unknown function (DUF3071)